jgi:hypothetical protein
MFMVCESIFQIFQPQEQLPPHIFYLNARWVFKKTSLMSETVLASSEQLRDVQAERTMERVASDSDGTQQKSLQYGRMLSQTLKWNDMLAQVKEAKAGAEKKSEDYSASVQRSLTSCGNLCNPIFTRHHL